MGEDESAVGEAVGNKAASESKMAGTPGESGKKDLDAFAGLTCGSVVAATWLDDVARTDVSVAGLREGKDEAEKDGEFAATLPDFEDARTGVNSSMGSRLELGSSPITVGTEAIGPWTVPASVRTEFDPLDAVLLLDVTLRSIEAISPESFRPRDRNKRVLAQCSPGPLTKAPPRKEAPTSMTTRIDWRTVEASLPWRMQLRGLLVKPGSCAIID